MRRSEAREAAVTPHSGSSDPAAAPSLMADPTRQSALELLALVLERRRTLEDALDALPAQQSRDRAAAHRLAASVLRRMGTLDAILEPFLRKEPPDPVRNILRIGAAGLLLLDTPPHAAVATAVALTRARGLSPFAGLVNAVLRKVATAGAAALDDLDAPRLDTPAWLWTSWGDKARAIATAHQLEAPLDLTLNPKNAAAGQRSSAESSNAGEGSPVGRLLPTGSLRFPAGTPVTAIAGFEAGASWVQDAAAALPAHLLAPRPGERVADLCAAPGGKTGQLAASGAMVTALDRDPIRLKRLTSNLMRWGIHADVIGADATIWEPPAPFDAILLDAPCSATGTIRRHPDVLRLKRARDVQAMTETQDRLIAAALAMLRPGGRLVYAVCSLQPEEAAPRIAAALARQNTSREPQVRHDPFTPDELAALPEALTPEGFLRTHPGLWPDLGGMDGFFAARLIRA
jgi:16S rRNA (cytosine967-C5)-methyltransferase